VELTRKQSDLLQQLVEADGLDAIMETVSDRITAEWRAADNLGTREQAHAKYMALRDVRREIRKLIGTNDDG
jgi:hypothetical protein